VGRQVTGDEPDEQRGRPTAVHAELDLTRIDTGNPRRDHDLRRPHLLDTAHYPALTFDGVADGATVVGALTGRMATRVSLDITSVTPGDTGTVTVHATTEFDRTALGVRAARFLIGRRIAVVIDAIFAPPSVRPPRQQDARCGQAERPLSVNLIAGGRGSVEDGAETS